MIYAFNDYIPVVHPSAFVHPQANVTGNVIIGADVYIGPGAVLRGDWGQIIIEDGCTVQENCVLHMFPGTKMTLRRGAHIGHGAIVHGATIGVNTLVGMNAVVMDDVTVGDECIVGALCFVPSGKEIPNRSVVVGNPAKIVKAVTDDMLTWKTEGTAWYQRLPQDCRDGLREVEPLREVPANRPVQDTGGLENWKRRSSK